MESEEVNNVVGVVVGNDDDDHNNNSNLFDLPEGCIANALSLTSPRDACRLSLVASLFRAAADSDAVWDRFLPSDYQEIVARSHGADGAGGPTATSKGFGSKKELFLHLCDHPIIIDCGTLSFSLEKATGKKCYMLAARALSIVWGDTPRYWMWTSLPECRFPEVAELVKVCWLEIHGKIDTRMLSPDTTYAAYFVYRTTEGKYGLEHEPAEASVGLTGVDSEKQTVHLDPEASQKHRYQIVPRPVNFHRVGRVRRRSATVPSESNGKYPKQRADGWMEVEMGEYVHLKEDGELQMSLTELKGGNWKSGLIVQGIEVRPKE